jgi:hypothetical protein
MQILSTGNQVSKCVHVVNKILRELKDVNFFSVLSSLEGLFNPWLHPERAKLSQGR